jgi:hypothetical protein
MPFGPCRDLSVDEPLLDSGHQRLALGDRQAEILWPRSSGRSACFSNTAASIASPGTPSSPVIWSRTLTRMVHLRCGVAGNELSTMAGVESSRPVRQPGCHYFGPCKPSEATGLHSG